jgi:hypothetical protein
MFRAVKDGDPARYKIRGVINVDATSEDAARGVGSRAEVERLTALLLKAGSVTSHLW